jgi:hypothetical protein
VGIQNRNGSNSFIRVRMNCLFKCVLGSIESPALMEPTYLVGAHAMTS